MSIVILASTSVMVMQALARVAWAQAVAEQQGQVLLLSASKLTELELDLLQGTLREADSGSWQSGAQTYQWETSVSSDQKEPRLKTLTLDVRWQYRAHEEHRRFATRLLALPAPQ